MDTSAARSEITACEERLLHAFKEKDLHTLEELIHNDALFVLPNGRTITKPIVLESYRSGSTAMSITRSADRVIHLVGDTAIISVDQLLQGTYEEREVNAHFRYMRVWKRCNTQWQVIATAGVPIPT